MSLVSGFDVHLLATHASQMVPFVSTTDFTISYIATDENPADGGTKALDRTKQAVSARRLLGRSVATTKMA